jgi:hypothetical protein
MNSKYQHF